MALDKVQEYFKKWGKDKEILEFVTSSATVELAAQAVGVEPARIAKTICFKNGESAMLIVTAGDAKTDNKKFKDEFGFKAKMLTPEETLKFTGHSVVDYAPLA